MATKRKTTTAIVAGVTAAALLLGGTFAWTSISQQAKNETAGIVNVGGRLHDDFNGNNKDVYVENFTDPLNGGQPIYARIKLTEYMEVGQDAGGFGADVNGDGKTTAVPVVNGTSIDDKDNWPVHIPAELCTTCTNGDTCAIHDHWTWVMGGQTTFMPTFNKDKDSLAADINGTYHGTDDTDKIYYDDYVVYTTDENGGVVNEADKEAYDGEIYSVTGDAYYDDDADNQTNDHVNNVGVFKTETETHTAKQTVDGTVITMQAWIDGGRLPGNYWVYDTDGWAYWANPIMPGEATGLLLSNIEMTKNPGEKCYYAINVVAEFATVGDWEYFTGIDEEENANALELLEAASQSVATVTVTNVSGATLLTPGESYEFSANVTVNGQQVLAASDFEWSVLKANKTVAKSTIEIDADGKVMLKVDENESSKNLIVVAKAIDSDYLGALGMCSVAVDTHAIPDEITAIENIEAGSSTTVTIDDMTWYVLAKEEGKALIWAANVIPDKRMAFDTGDDASSRWDTSDVRTYLNGEYFDSLTTMKDFVVETTIYTADSYNRSGSYYETIDNVFLLSEADLTESCQFHILTDPKEYTLREVGTIVSDEMLALNAVTWLRSPCWMSHVVATSNKGGVGCHSLHSRYYLRPAMWVRYTPDIEVNVTVPDVELNENNYATVKDGTVITFEATAIADGKPIKNPEFVYELYDNSYETPSLVPDVITSEGVWDTTTYGGTSPGREYYVKVYVKGYPDEYVKISFFVQP